MALGRQLRLLLWKNFTLIRRKPLRLVIELVWPLVLFLILVAVKKTRPDLDKKMPECHYDGKAMPSAGPLPFLQSLVCTFSNKCHQTVTADEMPGVVDTYNTSLVSEIYYDLEKFLASQTEVGALVDLLDDLRFLDELRKNPPGNCTISLGSVLVDPAELQSAIQRQNISLSPGAIAELLNASLDFQSVNLTQYWLWSQELRNSNQNMSAVRSQVRDLVCTSDRSVEILRLGTWELTDQLTGELCNLTDTEFGEVVQDVVDDLNWPNLYQQLVNCSGKSLKVLNDERSLEEVERAWAAFQDLESLQKAFTELNATFTEARNDYRSDLNGSMVNMTSLMSQLFCGRNSTLSSDEEENMSKEMQDQLQNDDEDKSDDYVYQNDTTEFCNDVFKDLQKNQWSRLLWRQVKPMIRGKITYSPDTPAARAIVKQANSTFETLSRLKAVAQDWLELSPNISDYMENSGTVEMIREYLAEMSVLTSVDEMSAYFQSVLRQYLPPFIGSPLLPGLPNIPSALLSQIPLPGGLDWASYINKRMANVSDADFDRIMSMIRMYDRWLSNDITPGNITWRNCLNYTDEMMTTISNYLDCFEFNKFEGYDTEDDLVVQSIKYIEDEVLWAGVVFDLNTSDPETIPSFIPYKIRMDRDRVDTTSKFRVLDRFYSPGPRDKPLPDMKYFTYGFAFIQDMVSHGIMRLQTNMTEDDEIGIVGQQFPYPCYLYAKFVIFISRSIPLFMVLAWIYSVAMIVKGIVYEKEQRLKEVMKTMGLSNGVHWLAWFITCIVMMLASVILLLLTTVGGGVIEKANPSVLFVFFLAFSIATITQCFMFSVFFNKANMAAACAAIFYFIGYLPYSFCVNWEDVMTTGQKVLACFASTTAFGFGCGYIARYEEVGEGLQWSNIAKSPVIGDNFNMAKVILVLLGDALVYWIIAWYVEAVRPGEFGMPRPWYFCFTKSYWCSGYATRDDLAYTVDEQMYGEQKDHFENEPSHLPLGVAIRGLRKIYKRGNKVAVDGLTLNFYEGQITSFLGHNGAGKTTTMSILTGLFPPTSGTAYIYNKDIRRDIDDIRRDLGMCPQHNVLFDGLTVEEHLWFYGMLKGSTSKQIKSDLSTMIRDIGLVSKKKEVASKLSGGMKRKLSVAISFVGGSKVVILDEPTAGVDPYARRSIWDLLLKYRKDRTILLSTHFMDEADILGDRIAIIAQGKLCCCGSSLFLKSQFGSGYYLTLVKMGEEDSRALAEGRRQQDRTAASLSGMKVINETGKDEGFVDVGNGTSTSGASSNTDIPGSCVTSEVTSFIKDIIPDAALVEDVGSELTYQLPDDKHHTAMFDRLFVALDKNLGSLRLSSYGISDTTLEEVFLKVSEETGVDEELNDEKRRQQMEVLTDGGNVARPVTRLSFRKHKKFSILGLKKKPTDQRELMDKDAISDAGSVLGDDDDDDEVFMETDGNSIGVPIELTNQCDGAGSVTLSGAPLILRQFWAQLVKRFHHMRRSKKAFVVQIVLPAVFICLAMVFAMVNPPSPDQPSMEIQPWRLIPDQIDDLHLYSFFSNDAPGTEWADKFEELIQSRPGLGVRCMNPDLYTIKDFPCKDIVSESSKWTDSKGNGSVTKECDCGTGYQICPEGAGGPEPSKMLLPSSEYMYNVTGRNITEWILKTHEEFIRQRYGGLSFGERNSLVLVNTTMVEEQVRRMVVAANGGQDPGYDVNIKTPKIFQDLEYLVENLASKKNAKIWFNNKGYVSFVAYMNIMNNLILRAHLPDGKRAMDYGISVSNHPMNRTRQQLSEYTFSANIRDVLIAISVIFAMSNVPASFIMFLCEERASNSKHLQLVSGINPVIYWLANFTWDMCNYLVSATLCILIMVAFQVQSYVSSDNAPGLVSLMLLYGWSIIPLMYPFSFMFKVPSTAFVAMSCLNIFLGIISTLSTFILEGFMEEDLDRINDILMKVFLLLPHYCLGRGLIDMTRNQIIADTFAILGEDLFKSPFSWDILGRNLLCMTALGPVFFLITIAMQYRFWIHKLPCLRAKSSVPSDADPEEDIDVARERRRVSSGTTSNDVLTINGLTKVYRKTKGKGRKRAVDNISVGVHTGECFGLLGVNGAGKTTTFKMLTGDTGVSRGDAHLAGHSILKDMTKVHQNLGYCPQFDALCPLLTGREHLELYARLRGVPEKDVKIVAAWAIRKLGLTRYVNKCAGDYSGGNRRKLSTAISLVGNPPVVFLDEPTTGMDPKARRFLWNCISEVMKDGRSVILTSHSMEECEALCSRIAIMVNGTFKCMGSTQHLKNRYGDGYTVILRISGSNPDMDPIMTFFQRVFSGCQLQEKHHNMVQYQLGSAQTSLSYVFGQLEAVREDLHIEDYSVCQTTLDQVFINFAKLQTDLDDEEMEEAMAVPYPSDSLQGSSGVGTASPTPASTPYTPVKAGSPSPDSPSPDSTQTPPNKDSWSQAPPSMLLDKPRLSAAQYHGIQNTLYDSEEESLRGSQIDLLPPSRSGSARSRSPIPDVSNC